LARVYIVVPEHQRQQTEEISMRAMKCLLAISAAAVLTFGAGAVFGADPVKIRVAWTVPVTNWGSLLLEKPDLARHAGKSYVMEPVHFQGTPPMITALANGELEIADFAFSSFAVAVLNAGMDDLRVIADEFQDGVEGSYSDEFFVLKDSPIKSVKDLKGKVLATNAVGSGVDIAMRGMLRKAGLDDKKDVTFVEVAFPNMKAMLLEKKADLVAGAPPFSFDPQLRAAARPLFVQKEGVGTTQMIVWAARAEFLQKNRAAMVDFMEDTLRIVRFFLDPKNHDEVIKIASKVSKRPPELFKGWAFTKNGQKGDFYRDPNMLPNLDALQANIRLQKELGFIKADIDIRKHADLSIVQEAAKRLK
jgi:sulfonate transport system substrate-binding protein